MTRRIIGLFSHSALAVAPSVPPSARDASGRIRARDEPAGTIELDDGSVFCLPPSLAELSLKPGTEVHILYV